GKEDEGGFSSVPEVEQHVVEDKEPQGPLHVTPFGAVKAMEDPQLARKTPGTFPELAPGKPRHTVDHMDLYKFMGRAHYLWGHKFTKTDMQYTFQIPLSPIKEGFVTGTLRWFLSLFQLYRGSLDITMTFAGKTNVDGIVYFVPEGVAIETEREEQTPLLTLNYKTSVGAIRFNTGQTTNVQFRIPFYTPLEHIATHSKNAMDSVLGAITTQITNYSAQDEYLQVTYYISFNEDSQFSVPRAVPVVSSFTDTSSKTVMNTYWLDDDELVEESSHSSFDEIEE
nr:putative VP1 [tremovirus A1]